MRSGDTTTIYMVDYETDSSMVREYMTNNEFSNLLKAERNGFIKIMNHVLIVGSKSRKA